MTTTRVVPTAPIQGTERMDTLDAVRGAAVLGILLINTLPLSGHAFVPPEAHLALPLASWHEPLFRLMFVLVETKFYSMFSFLFGVGFSVFIGRASARGADAIHLFKRRLIGLLLIGLVHTTLIWMGDILATYAVIGFALIPFVGKSDRTVIRWAVTMLLLPIGLYALILGIAAIFSPQGVQYSAGEVPSSGVPPFLEPAVHSFASGTYIDVVKGNIIFTLAGVARRLALMFFPRVFGMFLLGFYVGRRNMFAEIDRHTLLLRRVFLWGTVIGLPLSYAGALLEGNSMAAPNVLGFVETAVKSIGAPLLSLAYAAGLCLLFQRARALRRAFAAAGQMALTNYLMHSIVGVAIFYGIGLGLFGRVPLAIVVAGAIAFFALQTVLSRWWLSHAAFGPAEWVWRMFTYRRRVPLF
jgi:uncharacterized protein